MQKKNAIFFFFSIFKNKSKYLTINFTFRKNHKICNRYFRGPVDCWAGLIRVFPLWANGKLLIKNKGLKKAQSTVVSSPNFCSSAFRHCHSREPCSRHTRANPSLRDIPVRLTPHMKSKRVGKHKLLGGKKSGQISPLRL